jgi:hypothetical protein
MSVIKDIIQWKYERASWQWDVLCILIMCFIFLTPKSWFDKRDNLATFVPTSSVQQTDSETKQNTQSTK